MKFTRSSRPIIRLKRIICIFTYIRSFHSFYEAAFDGWSDWATKYHSIKLRRDEMWGPMEQADTLIVFDRGSCVFYNKSGTNIDEGKYVF